MIGRVVGDTLCSNIKFLILSIRFFKRGESIRNAKFLFYQLGSSNRQQVLQMVRVVEKEQSKREISTNLAYSNKYQEPFDLSVDWRETIQAPRALVLLNSCGKIFRSKIILFARILKEFSLCLIKFNSFQIGSFTLFFLS